MGMLITGNRYPNGHSSSVGQTRGSVNLSHNLICVKVANMPTSVVHNGDILTNEQGLNSLHFVRTHEIFFSRFKIKMHCVP